jgi:hypothetical protein
MVATATALKCAQRNGGDMSLPDSDALLTRHQAAEALTEAGFPVSVTTLSTKATRGGGPEYLKFGPRTLYRWSSTLAWANGRLTAPRRSTSEGDAQVAA